MIAYFDNASTTFPKPREVYDFMDSFYRSAGASVGRGQYKLSADGAKIVFETRELLKEILLCPNKEVIFTPTATIALNMIIQGLMKKDFSGGKENRRGGEKMPKTVWISPFEHNAVTRVLHEFEESGRAEVKVLPIEKDFCYDFEKIERLFEETPPSILILSHASNVCGFVQPAEKLCVLAKNVGAVTVLDMAQSAGLVPLNLASDIFDFAVFAGHKTLLGPMGASGFVMKKDFDLPPVLFGGTGLESANQNMPHDLPARYEMGTQNIHAIAGLKAALKWWRENAENIRKKEAENHERLLYVLRKYDFVKIVGASAIQHDKAASEPDVADVSLSGLVRQSFVGIVSCTFDGYTADEIGTVLDEQNIAVRTGLQCAPLAHKTLGTFPAGTVRFSSGAFTGEREFAELERAMKYIAGNL